MNEYTYTHTHIHTPYMQIHGEKEDTPRRLELVMIAFVAALNAPAADNGRVMALKGL